MMMNRLRLEEDRTVKIITKEVRNLFISRKVIHSKTIKDIRDLLKLKKQNETIKIKIITGIRILLELENEESYKEPIRAVNLYSHNYIKYENNVIERKHYQLNNILIKLDHD